MTKNPIHIVRVAGALWPLRGRHAHPLRVAGLGLLVDVHDPQPPALQGNAELMQLMSEPVAAGETVETADGVQFKLLQVIVEVA